MIFNFCITLFYLHLTASRVSTIALPLFVASMFNMVLWISQSGMGDDLFLVSAVLLDLGTVLIMMIAAKLDERDFIIDGIFRQGILLVVASCAHVLQLVDINEGTNFVFDNYGILINLIIILQILSLGVTMYGERIRNNWAYLRDSFSTLSRNWKSSPLCGISGDDMGNVNKVNKLVSIEKGFEE